MNTKDREHSELLSQFEKDNNHLRLDKEDKALWPTGNIFQDGKANEAFQNYRKGYALAKAIYQS